MDWLVRTSLQRPLLVGMGCLLLGLLGGFVVEVSGLCGFFGRFGSLTVALGALAFGAIASDLLIRAQVGRFADDNGDLPHPYSRTHLRKVLGVQAIVVFLGTLQWGFGDLLRLGECAQ